MKSTTVYLVQLSDPLRELAMLAAREIFPRDQLQLVPARTVGEAVQLPGQGRQLLVIGEANEADLGLAAQTLDATELPRWAVVHLGRTPSDLVETVPPEGCTARLLARILRSAVLHQELLRENLQLRGDLKTIARRINHDIRTPLGCIDTVCSLLQDPLLRGTGQTGDTVAAIRSSTQEISTLLDRLSFVLKACSEPLPAASLPMGPMVQKVIAQLTADHELRGTRISQPPQWPEVNAVEAWVAFVWTHLIRNAVRHATRGRQIQLGWEPRGSEIRFWVANEGAVPIALQPHLLRPFHLLHHQPSAGLGLSLVDRLVTLQGGRTGYETTPDKQALFYFTLSAARPVARPAPTVASFAESRAG